MQSTDEQKPVIEEQYDQILKLKRRLLVATCVAAISTAAFLGVSILLGVTHLSNGSASYAARQEAEMLRVMAQNQRVMAQNTQMSYQQALRAQQMAQQAAAMAQQQGGMGMMGADSSAAGGAGAAGFASGGFGAGAFGAGSSAASDEEPVVAPVPSTE